jgi:hypothetical protein
MPRSCYKNGTKLHYDNSPGEILGCLRFISAAYQQPNIYSQDQEESGRAAISGYLINNKSVIRPIVNSGYVSFHSVEVVDDTGSRGKRERPCRLVKQSWMAP